MTPRPHAEIIRAWADGHEVQYRRPGSNEWVDSPDPAFVSDYEYRVKPVRVFPETLLSDGEITPKWKELRNDHMLNYEEERRELINYGIKHAIDNGQVVPMSEVQEVARELAKNESPQWPPAVKKRLVDCLLDIRDSANRIFPTARINTPDGELLFSDYITRTLKAAAADVN